MKATAFEWKNLTPTSWADVVEIGEENLLERYTILFIFLTGQKILTRHRKLDLGVIRPEMEIQFLPLLLSAQLFSCSSYCQQMVKLVGLPATCRNFATFEHVEKHILAKALLHNVWSRHGAAKVELIACSLGLAPACFAHPTCWPTLKNQKKKAHFHIFRYFSHPNCFLFLGQTLEAQFSEVLLALGAWHLASVEVPTSLPRRALVAAAAARLTSLPAGAGG